MEQFLNHLKSKNYQNRKIALIENGTWAPSAARTMKGILDQMKNITVCEKIVTIRSTLKEENINEFEELIDQLYK